VKPRLAAMERNHKHVAARQSGHECFFRIDGERIGERYHHQGRGRRRDAQAVVERPLVPAAVPIVGEQVRPAGFEPADLKWNVFETVELPDYPDVKYRVVLARGRRGWLLDDLNPSDAVAGSLC
jgi:hypothetical protein